jgi:hypothetical protein
MRALSKPIPMAVLVDAWRYHKSFYTNYTKIENTYRKVGHKTKAFHYMVKANDHAFEMETLAQQIHKRLQNRG